jgi:alkylation response protein AidB-like acyl-CoA dehydrogenase
VPKENLILGVGRGFEVSQGRLGPGRIHHCMRAIGQSSGRSSAVPRALSREAFGKPLAQLGANYDIIAESRMKIEMARLLCLKAAYMMDTVASRERLALDLADQGDRAAHRAGDHRRGRADARCDGHHAGRAAGAYVDSPAHDCASPTVPDADPPPPGSPAPSSSDYTIQKICRCPSPRLRERVGVGRRHTFTLE